MLQVVVHEEEARRVRRRTSPDEDDGSEVGSFILIHNIFFTVFIKNKSLSNTMMELEIQNCLHWYSAQILVLTFT